VGLAACGGSTAIPTSTTAPAAKSTAAPVQAATQPTAQSAAKPAAASSGAVTLAFWTNWSGNQKETWNKLMDEFHTARPTITIQSSFDSLADLQTKVTTSLAGGAPPDM